MFDEEMDKLERANSDLQRDIKRIRNKTLVIMILILVMIFLCFIAPLIF